LERCLQSEDIPSPFFVNRLTLRMLLTSYISTFYSSPLSRVIFLILKATFDVNHYLCPDSYATRAGKTSFPGTTIPRVFRQWSYPQVRKSFCAIYTTNCVKCEMCVCMPSFNRKFVQPLIRFVFDLVLFGD